MNTPTFNFVAPDGVNTGRFLVSPSGMLSGFVDATSVTTLQSGWRYRLELTARVFDSTVGDRVTFDDASP